MRRSLAYIYILMLVVGCKPTVPSEYIQPDEMEDILYEYHLSQAVAKSGDVENEALNKNMYFRSVLEKHQVTEADFDSSLVYYYSHVYRLKDIYSHVNERLTETAKDLGAAVGATNFYSQYSATGDTANIWQQATDVLLVPYPTMNRYDFTVVADSSFRVGDSFMFQFNSEHIYQSGARDAVVCMIAKYDGDSIVQVLNHISGMGVSQLRIPSNREKKIRQIYGYIYLGHGDDPVDIRKMMFISQMQLIRFHSKETPIANETEHKDSVSVEVKEDSVQPVGHMPRPVPDTTRHRDIQRNRRQTVPPAGGAAIHRVVTGPNPAKK